MIIMVTANTNSYGGIFPFLQDNSDQKIGHSQTLSAKFEYLKKKNFIFWKIFKYFLEIFRRFISIAKEFLRPLYKMDLI